MLARIARFERLLQVMSDRERVLQEDVQRGAAACRQAERELAALQPPDPPAWPERAAVSGHRERYAAWVETERTAAWERLQRARADMRARQHRAGQVAQTRRTLERLIARLAERQRRQRLRLEQDASDAYAQRHARE